MADWSVVATLLNIIPYEKWLEIGLGISLYLILVLLIVCVGILYPFPDLRHAKINRSLLDITIGGLFALLGSFFVAAIAGDGPFQNSILKIVVFGSFVGITIFLCIRIFKSPPPTN